MASSTDTGDDHDTDIDDPTPLPPPRPRRWARRAKEQSMVLNSESSTTGKVSDEHSKSDDPASPTDWSRSVPKFPLPTFKPTMQSKLSIITKKQLIVCFKKCVVPAKLQTKNLYVSVNIYSSIF